jgi:type I restriction enzyme S subunit
MMDIARHERQRFTVRFGDLLVCEGGEVGRAAIVDGGASGLGYQKALHRLRPKKQSECPRFQYFSLFAAASAGAFVAGGNPNTIPHLTGVKLRRHRLPTPPADEQRAIADFLDRETASLDTLVGKKRELIEKLKEKRSALISRTVTRGLPAEAGLNSHRKLKPSGIEWLGDIPEHWDVKPFRHLMTDGTRNGLYKSAEFADPDGTPIIQMGEAFAAPVVETTASDRLRLTAQEKETWGLEKDDLLFARRSLVFEGSGKCSMIGELPEHHVFESSLIRVRPRRDRINATFLFWFIRGAFSRAQILAITKQVTISGLDTQQLKRIAILCPPIREQEAIADYLDRETAKLDRMMEKVEAAIEKLQEYRTALITAAVTGKIDVREAMASQPSD